MQNFIHKNQEKPSVMEDQSGQTFLEFMLLLLVLITLSIGILVKGFNGGIADRWQALIKVISSPTETSLDLR